MATTKQDIVDALLALSENKGLARVSLNDLAKAVGIRKASIYSHFESQMALIGEALAYCRGKLKRGGFNVNFKAKDARSLLGQLISGFLDTFTERPISSYFSILEQERMVSREADRLYRDLTAMVTARIRVALEYCVQRGWLDIPDTDIASDFFTSAMLRSLSDVISNPDEAWEVDRLIDGFITLFR